MDPVRTLSFPILTHLFNMNSKENLSFLRNICLMQNEHKEHKEKAQREEQEE